jgi:hypothetical protein
MVYLVPCLGHQVVAVVVVQAVLVLGAVQALVHGTGIVDELILVSGKVIVVCMARILIQAQEKLQATYAVVNMVVVEAVKVTVGHRPVVMVVKVVCALFGEQDAPSQVQIPQT